MAQQRSFGESGERVSEGLGEQREVVVTRVGEERAGQGRHGARETRLLREFGKSGVRTQRDRNPRLASNPRPSCQHRRSSEHLTQEASFRPNGRACCLSLARSLSPCLEMTQESPALGLNNFDARFPEVQRPLARITICVCLICDGCVRNSALALGAGMSLLEVEGVEQRRRD